MIIKHNSKILTFNAQIIARVKPVIIERYGALYNWYVVRESTDSLNKSLLPNMRVSSTDDWDLLINYLVSTYNDIITSNIGNKLKSFRTLPHFNHPRWNEGSNGEGLFNLNISGSGHIGAQSGNSIGIGVNGFYWTSLDIPGSSTTAKHFRFDNSSIMTDSYFKTNGFSIRCVRNASSAEFTLQDGTIVGHVQDYDKNRYTLIKIGDLVWTAQNLLTTHFTDGSTIPIINSSSGWNSNYNTSNPGMAWFDYNPDFQGI